MSVFKEAIKTFNTEALTLVKADLGNSTNASDVGGTGEEPVINQGPARQDNRGGLSAESTKVNQICG